MDGEWAPQAASLCGVESGDANSTGVPAQSAEKAVDGHVLVQPPLPAASRRSATPETVGQDKEKQASQPNLADRSKFGSGFVDEDASTTSSSFLALLTELEQEGIVTVQHGDVPPRLTGICGWTVHDDKMDEWKRRRQMWFMKGKEGKQYKANSFYQFLRRLGFFPTEGTKRASHGLDFDGSRTFKWDGSRRHKYIQSKKEKDAILAHNNSRSILRAVPGQMHMAAAPMDLMGGMGGMVMGNWMSGPMEGGAGAGGALGGGSRQQLAMHAAGLYPHAAAPLPMSLHANMNNIGPMLQYPWGSLHHHTPQGPPAHGVAYQGMPTSSGVGVAGVGGGGGGMVWSGGGDQFVHGLRLVGQTTNGSNGVQGMQGMQSYAQQGSNPNGHANQAERTRSTQHNNNNNNSSSSTSSSNNNNNKSMPALDSTLPNILPM